MAPLFFVSGTAGEWRGLSYIKRGSGWRAMRRAAGCVWLLLASLPAVSGLTPEQRAALPPAATGAVDFTRQIQPLFAESCVKCHGRGRGQGGFSLETRAAVLRGGVSGPAAIPGNSAESLLIELVSGVNPDDVMPKKGRRLTPEQVGLLRAWIDQGLPWDERLSFARPAPANLTPRKPVPPDAPGDRSNPIDRWLAPYYAAHQFTPPRGVTDRRFLRRLYLDAIGLLPAPADLAAFQRDPDPDKAARWVDKALADNQRYAEHWLSFWNDALRNDYQGTGYIDGGRQQITPWLFDALAKNLPYDRFVAQLVDPGPGSEGFAGGIVWRGTVNASQTPPMQTAQNISHVFMGINLKCASCHDSFINDWTLADAYGMAGIYADGPLEMVRCDKPTGNKATVKFLFSELGTIDPALDLKGRRQRLAEIMTQPRNGRLSRTIVNRLWAKFMGRGLVEPVDDMDQPAWNQDLLDWLAADLVEHGYDLKRTLALIFTSAAYRLPAAEEGGARTYVFRGPRVRRLNAEQYLDAVSDLTGVWHALPANAEIDFAVAADPAANRQTLGLAAQARRIGVKASEPNASGPWYLRKTIRLDAPLAEAAMVCAGEAAFSVFINGQPVANGGPNRRPVLAEIQSQLRAGENVVAVKIDKRVVETVAGGGPTNAGFVFYARLRAVAGDGGEPHVAELISDATWLQSTRLATNWAQPEFAPAGWAAVDDLSGEPPQSWPGARAFLTAASQTAQLRHTRAGLVNGDALMTALGRPNREQTVTTRADAATTLQALELMNGATLAGWLQQGARRWLEPSPGQPPGTRALIERLYQRALGRAPSPPEIELAAGLVGEPAHPEGLEDFLWAMIMLPEFQLIY
jgi:mono/diheme cytochrome c family protein